MKKMGFYLIATVQIRSHSFNGLLFILHTTKTWYTLDVLGQVDDEAGDDDGYVVPLMSLILKIFVYQKVLHILELKGRQDFLLWLPFMHS